MTWLRFLNPFRCRHRDMYRERRPFAPGSKVLVMHLVCDCGHAVPAVRRSLSEHKAAVKLGAVKTGKARSKQIADVVPMPRRGLR